MKLCTPPATERPLRCLRVLLIVGLVLAACGPANRRRGQTYGDRARNAYEDAVEIMQRGDPIEAGEALRRVRREYGLSRWGWLAELRLADLDVMQEHYTQAVTAFRSWIRYHPTQPDVVYAHFAIARAYFRQIPRDIAIFLQSWERDQSVTLDAQTELTRFIEDYARSEYAPQAREMLRQVREWLARGEIHIGQFYASRNNHDAAILRYRVVIETYRGSGLEPEALLRIGESYLSMGRRPQAREAFQTLVALFPQSGHAESARRYLAFLSRAARLDDSREPSSAHI